MGRVTPSATVSRSFPTGYHQPLVYSSHSWCLPVTILGTAIPKDTALTGVSIAATASTVWRYLGGAAARWCCAFAVLGITPFPAMARSISTPPAPVSALVSSSWRCKDSEWSLRTENNRTHRSCRYRWDLYLQHHSGPYCSLSERECLSELIKPREMLDA
jgi:hypothetical protein